MATHTVTISATTATPSPLTISDDEGHSANTTTGDQNLTTNVQAGDTLKWVIKSGCDISSIDAITYVSGIAVFSTNPTKQNDGSWEGVISGDVGDEESYSITYTVNGTQYTEDPKIKLHT